MKAAVFILCLAFCSVQCRKTYKPIDKNANIDFINMESGGMKPAGNARPGQIPAQRPTIPVPTAPAKIPTVPQHQAPAPKPIISPTTIKPAAPAQPPYQIKPIPVNPAPAARPITTPGPGSVQHLVNFYDSQGKGSLIRPYSDAVKQG